jgi:hypothetical protein
MLRIRYRDGITVGPYGFPDWIPYARAVVELPPVRPGDAHRARLVDVLTANTAMAGHGGPLWTDVEPPGTPIGWTWAHLAMSRQIALVPVELHAAYRHLGGVSTGPAHNPGPGLPVDDAEPPRIRFTERLSDDALAGLEEQLGVALPPAYRGFLGRTNGGRPVPAAVHPGFGFLADQPFFGVARADRLQNLGYANAWFGDRLTADWLAIGYVQGGLVVVKVRGTGTGSIWYWDDDDPRDADEYTAEEICDRLLHRCADDFDSFWYTLRPVPASLLALARDGLVLTPERLGTSLPAARR